MRIMLIVPPYIDKCEIPGMRFDVKVENLGLEYIKSYLNVNNYMDVNIIHCQQDEIDLQGLQYILKMESPDILGISIAFESTDYIGGIESARIYKELYPERVVFAGGHAATFGYTKLLNDCSYIDYVVISEGERTTLELISAMEGVFEPSKIPGLAYRTKRKIIVTQKRELISNLDMLPFPNRDGYKKHKPDYALIETSRGCWGRCRFCSVPAFFSYCDGPIWRTRSAENIVEEVTQIYTQWGITKFDFVDDNFIGNGEVGRKKVETFVKLIKNREIDIKFNVACRVDSISVDVFKMLKEVGLNKIYIGIESGCDKTLKRYNKNVTKEDNKNAISIVKQLGVDAKLNFIMFDPWMSMEELLETLKFIDEMDCYSFIHWTSVLNSYKPCIGTDMYQTLSHEYRFLDESTFFISDSRFKSWLYQGNL